MTRNNVFFKILFAIELALLPMVIFANLYMPTWSVGLFIAGIIVAKIWLELFNDKTFVSTLIIAIGNVLVFTVLIILFISTSQIKLALGVGSLVVIIFVNIFKVTLWNKNISDTIMAVDYCHVLFEILTLIALAILSLFELLTNIGLFSLILTGVVSVAYKVFFTFKYTDFVAKVKKLFKRN